MISVDFNDSGNEIIKKNKTKENRQRTVENAEAKERTRTKSTMWLGSVIYHKKVEQKEPGRSLRRSARLVWHLTSSSLYTELITVMQRAQYYSNKARERQRERDWGRKTRNRTKRGGTTFSSRQNKFCVMNSCPDAVNLPPYEKYHTVHTDLYEINRLFL